MRKGKAVPCRHPERECNDECPEQEKRQAFLAEMTEGYEKRADQDLAIAKDDPGQTPERTRVQNLETAVDNLIGLIYCNQGYPDNCPDPQARPCIRGGKMCEHLAITIPWFQRERTQEETR